MITEAEMYWITRLDGIKESLLPLTIAPAVLGGVALVVWTIWACAHAADARTTPAKPPLQIKCVCLALLAVATLAGITRTFLPTTKEYAAIKIIPAIANNETLQQDGSELYKLAVGWAKEKLTTATEIKK